MMGKTAARAKRTFEVKNDMQAINALDNTTQQSSSLRKPPGDTTQPTLSKRRNGREEMPTKINRRAIAAHALINNLTGGGRSAVFNRHRLSAVGLGHDRVRQRNHVLLVSIGSSTAGTRGGRGRRGVVESDLTRAWVVLGAGRAVATARGIGLVTAGSVGGG